MLPVANDTTYGLAAASGRRDIGQAPTASQTRSAPARSGSTAYNVFDAAMPFGGYKQSGWGREMGKEALELYTETKSVCLKL